MLHKLAAARQLGFMPLVRRFWWRVRMAVRIALFHLLLKYGANGFSNSSVLLPVSPTRQTFLADFRRVRDSLSQTPDLDRACRRRVARQCDEIFANNATLRGVGTIELIFAPQNWYCFAADIAITVNRHDFLVPLVQSVILNDDSRAREKLNQLFDYWIENFELRRLIAEDTPIDAAIRLINWVWVFNCGVLQLGEDARKKLCRIIYLQLEYIRAWQSAGGNHLVLEALSAYILGQFFEEAGPAGRWVRWGRRTMLQQLHRQTTSDGVHTEQSMFYHQAVSTHYLKFFLTAAAAGDDIPPASAARFRKMLAYVHDTAKLNGTHPVLGDGELLVTDDREHWESRALIAAYSHLFEESIYRGFAAHINDACAWLLGCAVDSLKFSDKPPKSTIYRESGLAVLRDGDRSVFFDAAPFSDPEFPHHGHADALSVDVGVGITDVFVDPGGYGYYDDEFRRFFRSTAAHNTVTLDGRNQSELFGVLGYGRTAKSKLLGFSLADDVDWVSGTHDGYAPAKHVREIYLFKQPDQYLLVVDMLLADGDHAAVLHYHLPAEVSCTLSGLTIQMAADGREFQAAVVSDTEFTSRLISGQTAGAIQGWVSPETKKVVKSNTWEISGKFDNFSYFVTAISMRERASIAIQKTGDLSLQVSAPNRSYGLQLSRQTMSATVN